MWTRAGRAGAWSLVWLVGLLLLLAVAAAPVAAAEPSAEPAPTAEPTPASEPTPAATSEPSPSSEPTPAPTAEPTPVPTAEPTPTPSPDPTPDPTPAPPPPKPYALNLYRTAGYVRQYTGSWCVAAATQMMSNFARLSLSSSAWIDRYYARQDTIIRYAKTQDTLTRSAGTDPAGWAAALRKYAAVPTATWRSFTSYETALRHAVARLRATGKPVGLLAWNGRHAWVLHGFTATADPATTSAYTITGLRISGPLAGVDPRNGWMSPAALKYRWGRYYERDGYLGWYGKWVLVAA